MYEFWGYEVGWDIFMNSLAQARRTVALAVWDRDREIIQPSAGLPPVNATHPKTSQTKRSMSPNHHPVRGNVHQRMTNHIDGRGAH